MAEHLGLEQAFRQRGAVHGHERAAGAATVVVDELGDHLLAAAALTRDEDRGIGRRDFAGELDRASESRRGAQQGDLV